jgi:Flp pilus assembly protein protease CpaA
LLAVVWLSACAIIDARTHQVPNWLTLPAIPLAILAAWLARDSRGETLFVFVFHVVMMTLPLFVAWRSHILGGADLKIFLVLTLTNPLLVVAAWVGVMVYFFGLLILHHSRPTRFAGVPGFALGTGLFTIGQLAVLFTQHLAAG